MGEPIWVDTNSWWVPFVLLAIFIAGFATGVITNNT